MTIPPAIREMVYRYFGAGAHPDYAKTLPIMQRDPYRKVREELAQHWTLRDITDYNSDLGFVYALENHEDRPTVRLSLVGPFSVITDPTGEIISDPHLDEILASNGFSSLEREILELPVDIWEPEARGCLYEFLFEFDEGLPWAR